MSYITISGFYVETQMRKQRYYRACNLTLVPVKLSPVSQCLVEMPAGFSLRGLGTDGGVKALTRQVYVGIPGYIMAFLNVTLR